MHADKNKITPKKSSAAKSPKVNVPIEVNDATGEQEEDCDVMSHDEHYKRHTTGHVDLPSDSGDRPVTVEVIAEGGISEDPEMKEFLEMRNKPTRRPAYRRDFYYDFKRYKTKR